MSPFGTKYRVFYNEGDSMSPTIEDGDWIIVEKHPFFKKTWEIDRYDIIIANADGELLTKRIIGLAGDSIEIKEGIIYLNNKKIDGPFGNGVVSFFLVDENDDHLRYWSGPNRGERVVRLAEEKKIIVPSGHVWIIGDNRTISWFGLLKIEDIKNKLIIY